MPSPAEFQGLLIGAFSGLVVGFALFRSRWFFELTIGMVAAAILCGIVIDGVDGYLAWVRFSVGALPRFPAFLTGGAVGAGIGGVLGILTRRRAP